MEDDERKCAVMGSGSWDGSGRIRGCERIMSLRPVDLRECFVFVPGEDMVICRSCGANVTPALSSDEWREMLRPSSPTSPTAGYYGDA